MIRNTSSRVCISSMTPFQAEHFLAPDIEYKPKFKCLLTECVQGYPKKGRIPIWSPARTKKSVEFGVVRQVFQHELGPKIERGNRFIHGGRKQMRTVRDPRFSLGMLMPFAGIGCSPQIRTCLLGPLWFFVTGYGGNVEDLARSFEGLHLRLQDRFQPQYRHPIAQGRYIEFPLVSFPLFPFAAAHLPNGDAGRRDSSEPGQQVLEIIKEFPNGTPLSADHCRRQQAHDNYQDQGNERRAFRMLRHQFPRPKPRVAKSTRSDLFAWGSMP